MLTPASLFDQTALLARAERLVKAARAAGADAADAVAVRGVSVSVEVRDGAVEESESAEGDDLGLRVLIGKKQAVVSTNDMAGDGFAALAERAVAMARVAPEDKYAGLADATELATSIPDTRRATVPGAGHLPSLEQPQAFDAVVLPFLDSVS